MVIIYAVAFSADGQWLAAGGEAEARAASGSGRSQAGFFAVWETATGGLLLERQLKASVQSLAFSPTEPLLAVSRFDGRIDFLSATSWESTGKSFPHPWATDLAISHDGEFVVSGVNPAKRLFRIHPSCLWRFTVMRIADGQILKNVQWRTDIRATARGRRSLGYGLGDSTEFIEVGVRGCAVKYNVGCDCLVAHPTLKTWAGVSQKRLHIVSLEGMVSHVGQH